MTNGMKELLALASKNESLAKELESLSAENTSDTHERLISLAASHGITLAEDSFTQPDIPELDLGELDAVAGGAFNCSCTNGGYGTGPGGMCVCTVSGQGVGLNGDYWMN